LTTLRPKLWTGLSAAVLITASLSACGEKGSGEHAQGANTPAPAVGEGGEGGAEGGAAAGGEAGAQAAYVSVPADSRVALRLAHLKGFFLVAQKQTAGADAAAALAGQGMLEVWDAQPGAFKSAGLDEKVLRKAVETGAPGDIAAALTAIEAAQAKAGGDPSAVAKGMVSIATGLYSGVVTADGVDATEYQHSYGAILSAQQTLENAAKAKPALTGAKADMARLVGLWPAPEAPKAPTPAAQVSGQAARVELALS
jgi:hypothetical protein